jgi:hypothetical protein
MNMGSCSSCGLLYNINVLEVLEDCVGVYKCNYCGGIVYEG